MTPRNIRATEEDTPQPNPLEHEPELQIIPHDEADKREHAEEERHVIYEILNTPDVKLPWVQPSRKKERGRA